MNNSNAVKISAYLSNYQQCDGNGWKPVKILEGINQIKLLGNTT